jgi:hypothetical protein
MQIVPGVELVRSECRPASAARLKGGQLYGVGGKVKKYYGSWLPFLLDPSANAKVLPLGFHRAHLSLHVQKMKGQLCLTTIH